MLRDGHGLANLLLLEGWTAAEGVNAGTGAKRGGLSEVLGESALDCLLALGDVGQFGVHVADGVADQVEGVEAVHVLNLDVEMQNLVVLGDNLSQVGQLLYATQVV